MKKKNSDHLEEQIGVLEQEVLELSAQEAKVLAARLEKENELIRLKGLYAEQYVGKQYRKRYQNVVEYLKILSIDEAFLTIECFLFRDLSVGGIEFKRAQIARSTFPFSCLGSEISEETYEVAKKEFLERVFTLGEK